MGMRITNALVLADLHDNSGLGMFLHRIPMSLALYFDLTSENEDEQEGDNVEQEGSSFPHAYYSPPFREHPFCDNNRTIKSKYVWVSLEESCCFCMTQKVWHASSSITGFEKLPQCRIRMTSAPLS